MDETILLPSPNWFQLSGLAITHDGWIAYGGPSKSLCLLEPLPSDYNAVIREQPGYKAHIVNRAHPEKIVSVDISPEWPVKKLILAGSSDGSVKQWSITRENDGLKCKPSHAHEVHLAEKEEVIGVGYSNIEYAITVGGEGNIVRWQINTNIVKNLNHLMKNLKPSCMVCSPHIPLNVAVGTKQGVVFVLDLNGAGKCVYKVRAHDDEIIYLSWCPQYEVQVKKELKTISFATARMEKIRNEPEHVEKDRNIEKEASSTSEKDKTCKEASSTSEKDKTCKEASSTSEKDKICKEASSTSEKDKTCKEASSTSEKDKTFKEASSTSEKDKTCKEASSTSEKDKTCKEASSTSEKDKTCEDDIESENETVVEEDDMFDIYKDHEANEFGHKKYEPETIRVKVSKEKEESTNFLAECLKLKEEILNRKSEPEPSIESLVDALDKTHVDAGKKCDTVTTDKNKETSVGDTGNKSTKDNAKSETSRVKSKPSVSSVHIQRHLLVTIGKFGGVRVWSKSGKQVSQCTVPVNMTSKVKQGPKPTSSLSVLWYKPDVLLMADGKGQLLMSNPLVTDSKHKFDWTVVHSLHKRGLFSIVSRAPRVQHGDTALQDWHVVTSAQDRAVIEYSLVEKRAVRVHATCGGFVYSVAQCPYDARKIAACVGDGAVRVWESDTVERDEGGGAALTPGHVVSYWQNVQGKVLTLAWHPTRENVLAFATAESRVGILDTSNRHEKPAKVLQPALSGGVYGISWGEGGRLYASGGGELVMYNVDKINQGPVHVPVCLEGKVWKVSEVKWSERALLVGSHEGAVAVMTSSHPHALLTAAFPYTKVIHSIDWHPQQVSSSSEDSPNKNLIAVCSNDKVNHIAILELGETEDGSIRLSVVRTLVGHRGAVLRVAWSPHKEELLASTSGDTTVRVWDALSGACVSIFAGHTLASLGVCWSGVPSLSHVLVSGGGDCALRVWDMRDHPLDAFVDRKPEMTKGKKSHRYKDKSAKADKETPAPATIGDVDSESEEDTAIQKTGKRTKKVSKRFLFPMSTRQMLYSSAEACKLLLKKYKEKNSGNTPGNNTNNNSIVITNGTINKEENTAANMERIKENVVKIEEKAGNVEANAEKVEENARNIVDNAVEIVTDVNRTQENAKKIEENTIRIEDNSEGIQANANEDVEKINTNKQKVKVARINEKSCDFIKMFGSINELNELLDMELSRHTVSGSHEQWMCVCMLRGHVDRVFQFASQRDLVCPYLLSVAPCVSAKYWKDATQMYLAQIDRLIAKGEEHKLFESASYGGAVYRKVWSLLALHDARAAVNELVDAKLYKEAYVLCRVRYMDSIAEEILQKWSLASRFAGKFDESAMCYIVLGDLTQAATVLGLSKDESHLCLAAEIAKLTGQNTFANHIEEKTELIKLNKETVDVDEALEQLPSRMELLMKGNCKNDGSE